MSAEFKFVTTNGSPSMPYSDAEQELAELAAAGYRFLAMTTRPDGGTLVLMARHVPEPEW